MVDANVTDTSVQAHYDSPQKDRNRLQIHTHMRGTNELQNSCDDNDVEYKKKV